MIGSRDWWFSVNAPTLSVDVAILTPSQNQPTLLPMPQLNPPAHLHLLNANLTMATSVWPRKKSNFIFLSTRLWMAVTLVLTPLWLAPRYDTQEGFRSKVPAVSHALISSHYRGVSSVRKDGSRTGAGTPVHANLSVVATRLELNPYCFWLTKFDTSRWTKNIVVLPNIWSALLTCQPSVWSSHKV